MTNISQYHPDKNILTEYSAGSLDYAQAIAVKAHLHYCPKCLAEVKSLEKIGGALLDTLNIPADETTTETEMFDQLMQRIEKNESAINSNVNDNSADNMTNTFTISTPETCNSRSNNVVTRATNNHNQKYAHLPNVIKKMLSDQPLHWRRINAQLKSARLATGQNQYGVSLQKIQAGGRVPEHNHGGTEITVVLKGSFSDEDGIYHAGDFLLRQPGDIHRPRASDNEDCLCLSVEQAPVKLTSFIGRMINPFLRIHAI